MHTGQEVGPDYRLQSGAISGIVSREDRLGHPPSLHQGHHQQEATHLQQSGQQAGFDNAYDRDQHD